MTNILSIDWDYFMDVSNKIRANSFPDSPKEMSLSLSNMVWSNYYLSPHKEDLMSLKLKDDYNYLMEYIKNTELKNTIFASSISHLSIYYMFEEFNINDEVNLINIDFHHDSFKEIDDLNCGNWVNYILNEYDVNITWVKDKKSELSDLNNKIKVTEDIKVIEDFKPDYIFLCKSYLWSPPHFDDDFLNLFKEIFFKAKNSITYSEEVMKNRMPEVKENTKERKKEKKIMEEFLKKEAQND